MKKITHFYEEARSLILVDTLNIVHRSFYVYSRIPWKKFKGDPVELGFYRQVLGALAYCPWPALIIFAWDNRPLDRKRRFPFYKRNRVVTASFNPRAQAKALVKKVESWIAYKAGLEADDVIASAYLLWGRSKEKVIVLSNDRDLYSLLDNSNVIMLKGKEVIDRSKVQAELGLFYPSKISFYKAIIGDPSDNVPPVRPRLSRKVVAYLVNISKDLPTLLYNLEKELKFSSWEKRQVAYRYRFLFKPRLQRPKKKIVKYSTSPVAQEVLNTIKQKSIPLTISSIWEG